MSFLWHKVEHTGLNSPPDSMTAWNLGSGEPKDIFPNKLAGVELQIIHDWISEGAQNN